MHRALYTAFLVVLACMSFEAICLACSVEEGCLMSSDLVGDLSYDIEVVEASRVVSTPYVVFRTSTNPSLYPIHHLDDSCAGLYGWGVTKGSQWWLISLGVKSFETNEVDIPCGYIVPPYCRASLSRAHKTQDRAINIKSYQLYFCSKHRQYWKHYYYEGLAFDQVVWTDISIEIESLDAESVMH